MLTIASTTRPRPFFGVSQKFMYKTARSVFESLKGGLLVRCDTSDYSNYFLQGPEYIKHVPSISSLLSTMLKQRFAASFFNDRHGRAIKFIKVLK